ncbi:PREDICTED: uncharacterized protein LOC106552206 [Thamnophis sirtalis]|uniref:Uncharacterized protein LOC106552206 n=1 Tax=Thamnophis sirtalis TaxID=35019 RepID=A0A6I9YNP5_9SAUR|nr:PREDICTED: uncharacterized protein LOC106552206 [Thamnophis sirtalis]
MEVVTNQWARLSNFSNPGSNDHRFYNVEQAFAQAIQLPPIDTPVATLVSSSPVVSGDAADKLKSEDKWAELTLWKNFNATAWAIKSTSAASYFNRTMVMWLRQLQDRIPIQDDRIHQDLTKIIAASQFSADATLDTIKFASSALATSVTSRCLLWLRNWQMDNKAKWNLETALFKGPNHFGEALDPILVENKDKKKVLPSNAKKPEARSHPYCRQSYRAPDFDHHQRFSSFRSDRQFSRSSYQDPNRFQHQSRWPFQGGGGRPYRRRK